MRRPSFFLLDRSASAGALLPFLVAAALLLPGCPLKDGYYLEQDQGGGALSAGADAGGAPTLSNSGRPGTSDGGGASEAGGAYSAGGTSGAGNPAESGGDAGSGTAGCVSATHGHEYAFCFGSLTQADARADCGTLGMTLAVIDDEPENTWVAQTLAKTYGGSGTRAFIGANDATTEGEWRWADGVLFWSGGAAGNPVNGRYANWADGEPNNQSPIEGAADCLTMYLSDGTWADLSCDAELPYVCEPR